MLVLPIVMNQMIAEEHWGIGRAMPFAELVQLQERV